MLTADSDDWLAIFEARLEGIERVSVFWLSSVLLVFGLVAVLWWLPTPEEFHAISPLLNWGSALLMVTAVYYFIISLPLAIGMLPFLLSLSAIETWLATSMLPMLPIAIVAIVLAIAGLCVARKSAVAVAKDLQLAMIAPAYLLSLAYRKFGIPI